MDGAKRWGWIGDDSSSSGDDDVGDRWSATRRIVESNCETEEVEPGRFIRKCDKTEKILRDCVGKSSNNSSMVEKLKAPVADKRPVDKQRPKEAGPSSSLVEFVDVASSAMGDAIGDALSAPRSTDLFDAALDAQDSVAKISAALALLSGAVAKSIGLTSAEMQTLSEKHRRTEAGAMISVKSHEAEMKRAQSEYESVITGLRSNVDRLEADLKVKCYEVAEQDKHAAAAQTESDRRIKKLKRSRDDLNRLLSNSLHVAAESQKLADELQGKLIRYRDFMSNEVSKVKRRCYRDCMSMLLKKIRHVYPDANMAYFCDMADIPDVAVEPDWLYAYAEPVAAQDGAGGVEDREGTEVVTEDEETENTPADEAV